MYEDEGTNYSYEKGAFASIPFSYDEAKRELTIGRRSGEFPGMPKTRTFDIRWMSSDAPAAADFAAKADRSVEYTGEMVVVRRGQ